MATGVTGVSPYAAAPPPPPIQAGGSRKNKHIVGGQTSNVAYTPGANLLAARQGFQDNQQQAQPQSALARGFFQGQAPNNGPDFSQVATNQMQAGSQLAAGQAIGNTLNQHTLGNMRPANAPNGLGMGRSNALGVVRQHTLTGNEALDPGMSYTPLPTPPPTPTPPPSPVTTTGSTATTGTGTTGNTGGVGTVAPGTPAPVGPASPLQWALDIRQKVAAGGGVKVGNYIPGKIPGEVVQITGLKKYGNVYLPLVGQGADQQVHWAYRDLMDGNVTPVPPWNNGTTNPQPAAPTPAPPVAPPPPPPAPPAPVTSWAPQDVRSRITSQGGIKVGNYIPGPNGNGVQQITALKLYKGKYLPLVGTGANQQVHWAYRELM